MESIARPLRRLQEEASWFARAHELKVLRVRTDATLRAAVVDLLMAHEHHADNRALYFRFDDVVDAAGATWADRANRLRLDWADKTKSLIPAGIDLQPLGEAAGRSGRADFAGVLLRTASCLAAPVTQVMAVMAPARVEDPQGFLNDLTSLVAARELAHVRWIVVEVDGDAAAPLAHRLGAAALTCVCLIDDKEQQDDLAAQGAASVAGEPAGIVADADLTWRAPGAMPNVTPPPRVGSARRATDDELRAAGLSPKFVNGGGTNLKRLVLGGSLALRQGRQADAVTLQARAAALCAEMEMPREQILNLHVLGGYLMAGQAPVRAMEVYARAGELARVGGFAELHAQSELAMGMLETLGSRPAEAAPHYSAAGRLAEGAGVPSLAIECWRMAGQLAVEARLETSAAECWKRALTLADPLDPKVAQMTTAAEIARALAALCRKRGLTAQAKSLEQRSVELEQGSGTAAPVAAAP